MDQALRQYLFDQGIDYPFSTPLSPSGRADVVAGLQAPEPIIIEVKIFDPDGGRDGSYIRRGFRQIYDYLSDYNKTVGYLVIFSVSGRSLQFKLTSSEYPQRIEFNNRVIYLVVIDIFPHEEPASKRGPLEPYVIEENYLTASSNNS